ncbi:cytochrome p450 domain-containing protein [Sarocladium implicatum]|nr:cytochrome p450 domain-containing protein [Sarocladium implicatum]
MIPQGAALESALWDWRIIAASLLSPFVLTYLVTLWNSSTTIRKWTDPTRPPTAPYYVPYFGHVIPFVTSPFELYKASWKRFGRQGLWKLALPGQDSYQVSSTEHVAKVFRSQGMIMTESHSRTHEFGFGMPRAGALLFEKDDSGYGPHPLQESTVEPDDRIMYHQHNFTIKNLSGESLSTLTRRYQEELVKTFTQLSGELGDEWVELPDLTEFLHKHVAHAAVIAIYGPHLLRLNPGFIDDLWSFFPWVMFLLLKLPRWLAPRVYRTRERLLEGIMRYYQHAEANYDAKGSEQQWEEHWGSRFTRTKHREFWGGFSAMDAKARAAEDLSFLWASNANSVEAAVWYILEMMRDSTLMDRVRAEVAEAKHPAGVKPQELFDLEKLCSLPVTQSAYAEVLRLRVSALILRRARHDLDFDGWSIKKGERVCAAAISRHQDSEIWNTGTGTDPHPLMEFWADRFLVYPDDPSSGPLKTPAAAGGTTAISEENEGDKPRFSTAGLTNTFIPYSGGARLCPGRHFAKQEIILTAAATVSAFDIELRTPEGWVPKMDTAFFGGGTLPVKGKVPCRIRRRKGGLDRM